METSKRALHLAIEVHLNHPDDAPLTIPILAYYYDESDPEVLIRDGSGRWWSRGAYRPIRIEPDKIKGWIYLPIIAESK